MFETRKLHVNGIDMNVLIAGKGPDVLLVHGYPDTHAVWRKQIPVLVQAGYRVIAPDTRGCGDTEISPKVSDYRVDNLVTDLVTLLDVMKIEKVRLVGHDWGAVIGWQVCLRHPERIERYVAMAVGHPSAYAHAGIEQKMRGYYILLMQLRGLSEALMKAFDWSLFRTLLAYPEEFPSIKAHTSRPGRLTAGLNYYRANFGMILPRRWGKVSVPVMGVWSSADRALVEAQMTASQRYVTGAWRYERIAGANHWLQLDAPEKVNPLLLEFLN